MCDAFALNILPCSSNGYCENNTCVCNGQWINTGDYTEIGQDCSLNINALDSLWVIGLVLMIVSLLLCALCLLQKLSQKNALKINDPVIIFLISLILSDVGGICLSIIKIMQFDSFLIGKSFTATILYNWSFVFECAGASSYIIVFRNFLKGHSKAQSMLVKKKIKRKKLMLQHISRSITAAAVVGAIISIIGVSFQQYILAFGSFTFFVHTIIVIIIVYGLGVEALLRMSEYIEIPAPNASTFQSEKWMRYVEKLEGLKFRLRVAGFAVTFGGSIISITYCLLGVWPSFAKLSSYFIPINAILVTLCKLSLVGVVSNWRCNLSDEADIDGIHNLHSRKNASYKSYSRWTKFRPGFKSQSRIFAGDRFSSVRRSLQKDPSKPVDGSPMPPQFADHNRLDDILYDLDEKVQEP